MQVLYAWELRGGRESLQEVDRQLTVEGARPPSARVRAYLTRLLAAIEGQRPEIDARLEALAENWRLSRMATVDRNILRIAAAEMLYFDEVPARVSLQEAIHLTESFGTDESRRFVNGVLDALLRELEPERLTDAR